ncbi:MAG: S8 family serine peptidase [Acidobacteriota bacterium]
MTKKGYRDKQSRSTKSGSKKLTARLLEPDDAGAPRFSPKDPTAGDLQPHWEAGKIQVQFKIGTRPELLPSTATLAPEIRSVANVNLSNLNQLLQANGLRQAEPSFQAVPSPADMTARVRDLQPPEPSNREHFVILHFPEDADLVRISEELNQLPEVERAVPVPKVLPPGTPGNEPRVGTSGQVTVDPGSGLENQWYIFRCNVDRIWDDEVSGEGVIIADIDWGYRITHQDLESRISVKHNSFDGGSDVTQGDSVSHGTAVLGIAGGADNELGMAGIAYGATLWAIQADSGPGTPVGGDSWANAIDWVRRTDSGGRRKIINLEVQTGGFGNIEMVPAVNQAIKDAIASGVVVCVAAGNGDRDAGIDDLGDPIPPTGSILVGATEYHPTENRRADFSNFGSGIIVSAPGDSSHDLTCSSAADDGYMNAFGGTSGATPKIAATAALMLSVNPRLSHAEVSAILRDTGTFIVTDAAKPVGTFLNAEAAVREANSRADNQ